MTVNKNKTLNEVGAPSEELQRAYEAVMAFHASDLGEITISKDLLDQFVAQEASIDHLQGGDHGFTAGMKSILRQATAGPLAKWLTLRSAFDSAIQPFMEKIQAVQDFQEKKGNFEQKAQEREKDVIRQAEASQPYLDKKHEKIKADQHYEQLIQGEGGRPVNLFAHTWWYILILIAITSIEWLINYDSFFDWTRIPAVAAGFTIGMALAVALAAHVHGEHLKQRNTRFGPASDHWGRDIYFLLIATAALGIAVMVAGYARYSSAMHNISSQIGITNIIEEGISKQIDPLTEVYFSLGINLIVWLIGLIVSFMSHDENHEIMRAGLEKWWRTKRFNWAHKPWTKQIMTIHAQAERDIARLRAATDLARISTEDQKNKLDQVEQREQTMYRVLANNTQAIIDLYRMALGKGLQSNGNHILIYGKSYTGQEYMQKPINIDADTIRTLIS